MSKNNYAHFIVMKMLKYGTAKDRSEIIKKFYGHIRELAKHKVRQTVRKNSYSQHASMVLQYAYSEIAKSQERQSILCEFYGPEFSLFRVSQQSNRFSYELGPT